MVKELKSHGCVMVNLEKNYIGAGNWGGGVNAQSTICLQIGSLIRLLEPY